MDAAHIKTMETQYKNKNDMHISESIRKLIVPYKKDGHLKRKVIQNEVVSDKHTHLLQHKTCQAIRSQFFDKILLFKNWHMVIMFLEFKSSVRADYLESIHIMLLFK